MGNPVTLTGANTTLNANSLTLAGAVTLSPTNVLSQANVLTVSQPATITGQISGLGSLVELGKSSLTLSPLQRSTYTGGTTLAAGTLILGSALAPLGTGALTLTGNATSASTLQTSVANGLTVSNPIVLDNAAPASGANVTLSGPDAFFFTGAVTVTGQTALAVNIPITPIGTTTFSGVVGGSGGLTQAGTGALVLSGNNTYTGATMITGGGSLVINGAQPNSPVGVVLGGLSGSGQTGFITVGPAGSDTAGPPGNGNGIQSAPGANFSEGGDLVVQVSGYVTPGTDFSSLNLGSGTLVLGGGAANFPSTLTLDLTNLITTGQANGVALFGAAVGTPAPVFSRLRIINNPNDYAAYLSYPGSTLDVIITAGVNGSTNVAATTSIWTGASGGDPSWSNGANWLGGSPPPSPATTSSSQPARPSWSPTTTSPPARRSTRSRSRGAATPSRATP